MNRSWLQEIKGQKKYFFLLGCGRKRIKKSVLRSLFCRLRLGAFQIPEPNSTSCLGSRFSYLIVKNSSLASESLLMAIKSQININTGMCPTSYRYVLSTILVNCYKATFFFYSNSTSWSRLMKLSFGCS